MQRLQRQSTWRFKQIRINAKRILIVMLLRCKIIYFWTELYDFWKLGKDQESDLSKYTSKCEPKYIFLYLLKEKGYSVYFWLHIKMWISCLHGTAPANKVFSDSFHRYDYYDNFYFVLRLRLILFYHFFEFIFVGNFTCALEPKENISRIQMFLILAGWCLRWIESANISETTCYK